MVEYRPKTHTQLQLPVGTVLSSLSTSFDLRIIYRCFPRMLQPSHKPWGYWNQGHTSLVLYWNRVPLLSKVEPQYSLRVFVDFGSFRKDGRNCIPLCRKGAVLVRDGYKEGSTLAYISSPRESKYSMDGFSFNVSLTEGGWMPLLYDLTTPKKGMTVAMCNCLLGDANIFFGVCIFDILSFPRWTSHLSFIAFVFMDTNILWFTLRQL
ncbi:hypothetical protein AVEN_53070-1 [Araneus ventricosus]|uniref:Uncharacterized protein n=1 Tax=Araneus ventricosus TaxID=182803 RepID=A0A4Y2REG1_ARAVE|nr:hypothetical protein AVEN_53070-1 [Araneus ventricosus]